MIESIFTIFLVALAVISVVVIVIINPPFDNSGEDETYDEDSEEKDKHGKND